MFILNLFPYYRKSVFDEIADKKNIIILHSKKNTGIKQVRTEYSKIIPAFRYSKNDTSVFLFTGFQIFRYRPNIIIHEFAIGIISLYCVYILTRLLKIKLILWSHGYDRKKGFDPTTSFSDKVRLYYLKKADGVLLYGLEDKKYLSDFIDKNKIFVSQNTFDTRTLSILRERFNKDGLEKIKKEIGFKHKYNLVFIGRLLRSKRPDILLDIYEKIKDKVNNDIGIHFVGDGEMMDEMEEYVYNHKYNNNIFLYGQIYDEEITGKMLFASDLMVMPGALGLSINHSFCFLCPVVSFKKGENGPYHGPEIEYVVNNETGFLIEQNNIDDMVKIIYNYFSDIKLQQKMKKYINNIISNVCSLENMVQNIIDCIENFE